MSQLILDDNHLSANIYIVRGQKVMLDRDLAVLYGIQTKVLNQAVKRQIERFPHDFMFQLTWEEYDDLINGVFDSRSQFVTLENFYENVSDSKSNKYELDNNSRSQFVTLNGKQGSNLKYLPYAFTEQGVAMLSSVINSIRAIEVNIAIMRTFVRMRQMILQNIELAERLKEFETMVITKFSEQDEKIEWLFDALDKLTEQKNEPREPIGFKK